MRFLLYFFVFLSLFYNNGNVAAQKEMQVEKPPEPRSVTRALEYRSVGPTRGGRVTAVSGVIAQPNVFYFGATGGGVWKTEDYGHHWSNISDGYFASPSIGAIAVFQADPNILYVGTGSDGLRSNVIIGKGMYKSTDAGKTWNHIGLTDGGLIGEILIHPANPEIVYVAVIGQPFRKSKERGVYMTRDGGENWQNILFHSDSVGCVDLAFAPNNPLVIYAAMWRAERKPWTIISGGATDGIYKSTDEGRSWERKTEGLPTGLVGKIDFAVSTDNPARLWALIQASHGEEGLYRSDDYGESWSHIIMPDKVHSSIMYRPFYFTNLTANPRNADNIWSGTKAFWTSFDGGQTWKRKPSTHADHHKLWIHPLDTLLMIEGNDGGAAVSRDGGENWSTVFNQPTAEMYSCYVDDRFPYSIYSGQQDNSTIRVPVHRPQLNVLSSNDNHGLEDMMFWERVGGCETGPVIPKPGDPDIIYANCKGQFSVYNRRTGLEQNYYVGAESLYGNHPDDITYRFQRVSPMEVSPFNHNKVYYGSQYVHVTTDGGVNWTKLSPDLTANKPEFRLRSGGPIDEDISGEEYYNVLYAIRESPLEKGLIWTGSNDGLFHVTRDGGQSWENVTPDMPEDGRVQNIEPSPHVPGKAYFAVNRDYLGDEETYFYRTNDYGQSWSRVVNGIPPGHPARVLREDPDREGLLYAGTEFGIFISFDDGENWLPFQQNLPVTPVTGLQVHRRDLVISTLGRSFWVMDDISPLHSLDPNAQEAGLFKPRNSYGREAFIHFIVPKDFIGEAVSLNISRDNIELFQKQLNLIDHPADAWGIRKAKWDLRYSLNEGEKAFKGPLVAPGVYSIGLEFDGKKFSQDLSYEINPEWKANGLTVEDLQEQEQITLKIAELLLEIKAEIRRLEGRLKANDNDGQTREMLTILKKGPARYDQPKLHEHTEYLYKMLSDTPQKPGRDAFVRYEELKAQWGDLQSR